MLVVNLKYIETSKQKTKYIAEGWSNDNQTQSLVLGFEKHPVRAPAAV